MKKLKRVFGSVANLTGGGRGSDQSGSGGSGSGGGLTSGQRSASGSLHDTRYCIYK